VLLRTFKPNLIDPKLLEEIAEEEANLSLLYSNFRPKLRGKSLSENDIREILKNETDAAVRREAWESSKEIGEVMAPHILKLVLLRNKAAKSLGYSDYFTMQLELQEVDETWLFNMLEMLAKESDSAYSQVFEEINARDPWDWSEPFCQEDPLDCRELDEIAKDIDILESARTFYQALGLDVDEILKRSDNFEREGKNQHAFCMHVDREGDIRTLNNIKPTIKWLETILHELGHAVYEQKFEKGLPWLLKEPPHMITTEAMALLAGRQAYRKVSLELLSSKSKASLKEKAEVSLRRRQLIFSRWVLVMTYFERELYKNPGQDLNKLWWSLVERFQKISYQGSPHGHDWAAKYHIGLAPVYYFSYLLGELFASALEVRTKEFASEGTGAFLAEKVFKPGNRWKWSELIEHATGEELSAKEWLKQFAN